MIYIYKNNYNQNKRDLILIGKDHKDALETLTKMINEERLDITFSTLEIKYVKLSEVQNWGTKER